MVEVTFTHLSGARRGAVETLAALPARLGRAPECEVRFDADADLKVSALHAEVRRGDGDGLVVADLGSTNGVLVNGARIAGAAPLPNHAIIEVGEGGPRVRVSFEVGAGSISFASLRRPDAAAARPGHGADLRTTDDHPAYREEDLGAAAPPRSRAGLVALAVALGLVAAGAAAWALLARGA